MNRLDKLRHKLEEKELDAILVSQPENLRYLASFTGSEGWLLFTSDKTLLAVDFRYLEQARNESKGKEIFQIKGRLIEWLPRLLSDLNVHQIGFEANHLAVSLYQQLIELSEKETSSLRFTATSGLIESLRAVKEPEETESITEAVRLTDKAFEYVWHYLRPGITEKELAWEMEKFLREAGSENLPFEVIVAAGPNSALPHARPSERKILKNEPILVDIGARINGYSSDLSRTFYLGEPDRSFTEIYETVLGAQLTALATIEAGMTGDMADSTARSVITEAGYADAFGHGLGHGIGLVAHEMPRLTPNSTDLLTEAMTFTIEPGIYIPGWGGVRIEDTTAIALNKPRTMSLTPKNLSAISRR